MKKIITTIAVVSSLSVMAWHNAVQVPDVPGYGVPLYFPSSVGTLVRLSDVVGVGEIQHATETNFMIKVEQALLGCATNQILSIFCLAEIEELPESGKVVFLVSSNNFEVAEYLRCWSVDTSMLAPPIVHTNYHIIHPCDSFFSTELDDGHPWAYITNVVRTLRTERNWTNYYEVCRDAVTHPSSRWVREAAEDDLRDLMMSASLNELLFMLNDSLFPAGMTDDLQHEIADAEAQNPSASFDKPPYWIRNGQTLSPQALDVLKSGFYPWWGRE